MAVFAILTAENINDTIHVILDIKIASKSFATEFIFAQ